MFTAMKDKITSTTIAAINGLTGLSFLGAIALIMIAKEVKDRFEE
tara:strand:- start:406 stop:540 length:135 start_codon:yes stop_codon:yes gene_type:complete